MIRRKGVTLIELLIVVMILGVLAGLAIPRIGKSSENAKQATCDQNVNIINEAIERYYIDNEEYPKSLNKILKNDDFFPHGEPECPFGGKYIYKQKDHTVECTHNRRGRRK